MYHDEKKISKREEEVKWKEEEEVEDEKHLETFYEEVNVDFVKDRKRD